MSFSISSLLTNAVQQINVKHKNTVFGTLQTILKFLLIVYYLLNLNFYK